ncbi:unnamed protein product [Arctogadus glacialis]
MLPPTGTIQRVTTQPQPVSPQYAVDPQPNLKRQIASQGFSLSTSLVNSLCRGSACVYALHCGPSYTSPAACIAGHLPALVQPPSRF